jgi:hypothetical protein
MYRRILFAVTLALLLLADSLHAQLKINFIPSVGPNVSTSPNAGNYANNAISALYQSIGASTGHLQGQVPALAPPGAAPVAYASMGNLIDNSQIIATPFNSWLGKAPRATTYSEKFGNTLYFGATVVRNARGATTFSLADVRYAISGNEPLLSSPGAVMTNSYIDSEVGIIAGMNGKLGANEDPFIASGINSQEIAAILLSSLAATGYHSTSFPVRGTNPDTINIELASLAGSTITGSGTVASPIVNRDTMTGRSAVNTFPGPASLAILGVGLGAAIGYVFYRRRRMVAIRSN